MSKITLTKDSVEGSFIQYMEKIFELPEIVSGCVKKNVITRENLQDVGRRAFEAGFHDEFSDTDLTLTVRLPEDGSVTPDEYLRRIDRFGITKETALGWMFVPVNHVCRSVFRNGTRYDLRFEFVFEGDEAVDLGSYSGTEENPDWPVENINRFWFTEVQALTKLYRKDHLISSHLANMNCSDTLVMQMIMRDHEYSTNHHRYGHSETLEYVSELGKMPYAFDDPTAGRIADHIYAAALAYDRLAVYFYPGYRARSEEFFAIWEAYESGRK